MGDDVLDARSTVLEEKSDISLPRSQRLLFIFMMGSLYIKIDGIFISAMRGDSSRL